MIAALVRGARRRRLQRRLAGPRLLRAFARAYPEATFAEIGANDGLQHDHLREAILARRWRGVMVEPVPYVFERLRANYGHLDRVALENVAVAEADGTATIHHLRQASEQELGELPEWYDGIGSFDREQVVSHARLIEGLESRIVSTEVPTLSFESLCRRHGLERIDLLAIDVEGYDAELLARIDLAAHRPRLVVYEHYHLDRPARDAARRRLRGAGYELLEEGFDTWCLRPDPDSLTRLFRRLRPAVPAATAAEERGRELELHDSGVPLPEGAESHLRDDHPRLLELRRRYAELDLPALARSRWSAEAVGSFLDLRRFRGETLITWHYRDEEQATRRRYAALLDCARRRDRLGLLDRLDEDGAFGCWRFELEGRTVSRDLLDSVNEINFLDRAIGIAGTPELRVLDIGAGYGRLAHRMAQSLPNLAEYACADAVAESSFVCEYHLRFRGVAPPARVVEPAELASWGRSEDAPWGAPGAGPRFDLAVNIHSFSEAPLAAIRWWVERLGELAVPHLLVVSNDAERLLSLEPDGTRRDFEPLLGAAGYEPLAAEPVLDDAAARRATGIEDRFALYELRADA